MCTNSRAWHTDAAWCSARRCSYGGRSRETQNWPENTASQRVQHSRGMGYRTRVRVEQTKLRTHQRARPRVGVTTRRFDVRLLLSKLSRQCVCARACVKSGPNTVRARKGAYRAYASHVMHEVVHTHTDVGKAMQAGSRLFSSSGQMASRTVLRTCTRVSLCVCGCVGLWVGARAVLD